MKIKNLLFVICFFLILPGFLLPVYSQQKELTLEDAIQGQVSYLFPEYLFRLSWRSQTDKFTYLKSTELVEGSVKSDKLQTIMTLEDLNAALKSVGLEEKRNFVPYQWKSENIIQLTTATDAIFYNLKTKKTEAKVSWDISAANMDFYEDKLAYTVENNLFISDKSDKKIQVTKDENKGIVNGQSVHRNEFGIEKGTFWSPKGTALAFYRMDESMVTDYPLVDVSQRAASLKSIKYPMAGMKSHEVTVGVFYPSEEKTVFLKTGEPREQYLTNLAWSPDEKYIFLAVINREQNHMKFNQYDALTGDFIKTLFEEKHERYVEPMNPALFLTKKPDHFIWQSRRDGFNHLYLYNIDGKLIRQLTKGDWLVTDVLGFDEKEENIFYVSTAVSPLERHLYKVGVNSGLIFKLGNEEGMHNYKMASSGKYFLDTYSNTKTPRITNLISSEGKLIRKLLESKNPLQDYKLGESSVFTIKAADNKTDLYAWMIKPLNFDPSKKYPAIIYVYGGPHAQMITNSWNAGISLWEYYMASLGYVVLTVDNRGSSNRGFEFESCIHRNVGDIEVADQMKGVEYLKSLGYVDMEKIGVHGWSYGGFMSISLMTKHNDIFKVGVAGGPVTDWKYYEVMYGERYMDSPDENPDGYKNASLLSRVNDLKGKLLIVHGYIDNTVVLQNSLSFIEECIKNGVQLDYFLYPTHEHNIPYGPDRVHLMKKVTQYFEDYLK